MQSAEVLENSHVLVGQSIDDLPESLWDLPGVCGEWSVKDVLSHLTAYELLLIDLFATLNNEPPSPYLLRWVDSQEDFNRAAVDARRYRTAQEVENEYEDVQARSTSLLAQIQPEKLTQKGTVPGRAPGKERSAADMINLLAGHTREHCEQIKQFREEHKDIV